MCSTVRRSTEASPSGKRGTSARPLIVAAEGDRRQHNPASCRPTVGDAQGAFKNQLAENKRKARDRAAGARGGSELFNMGPACGRTCFDCRTGAPMLAAVSAVPRYSSALVPAKTCSGILIGLMRRTHCIARQESSPPKPARERRRERGCDPTSTGGRERARSFFRGNAVAGGIEASSAALAAIGPDGAFRRARCPRAELADWPHICGPARRAHAPVWRLRRLQAAQRPVYL